VRRPLILFYNAFFDAYPDTSRLACAGECEFTSERSRMAEAGAVIFHLPRCPRIWEARKYPGQLWVGWSQESEVNVRALRRARFMAHFDLIATYRRCSDLWTSYVPRDVEQMLAAPSAKKEAAPAVLFLSSAHDRSGRNRYLHELMRRMRVDSYGRLARNRQIEGPDLGEATKLAVIARYKFCLGFENSIAPDYVTEKFFEPLLAGSVPVYRGAPNVAEFAPGPKSYIDAGDFSGPADLAAYLNHLAVDDKAYGEYQQWKQAGFSPAFKALVRSRQQDPLCQLCTILQQRSAVEPAAGYTRPFRLRQWHPAEILRRWRKPMPA
jgi:alpha-1,3-fucosyltransferase 10